MSRWGYPQPAEMRPVLPYGMNTVPARGRYAEGVRKGSERHRRALDGRIVRAHHYTTIGIWIEDGATLRELADIKGKSIAEMFHLIIDEYLERQE